MNERNVFELQTSVCKHPHEDFTPYLPFRTFYTNVRFYNVVDESNQILGTYLGWKSSLIGQFFILG